MYVVGVTVSLHRACADLLTLQSEAVVGLAEVGLLVAIVLEAHRCRTEPPSSSTERAPRFTSIFAGIATTFVVAAVACLAGASWMLANAHQQQAELTRRVAELTQENTRLASRLQFETERANKIIETNTNLEMERRSLSSESSKSTRSGASMRAYAQALRRVRELKNALGTTKWHSRRFRVCGLPTALAMPEPRVENDGEASDGMTRVARALSSYEHDPGIFKLRPPLAVDAPLRIPRLIAQTGPENRKTWSAAFTKAHGSFARMHPGWRHAFWNDSATLSRGFADLNPNTEAFVKKHFAWFYPTWKQLCKHIMKLDAARYMWLYVYGGVYADLDVEATARGDMERYLRGLDVALPGNNTAHAAEKGCWTQTIHSTATPSCGTHIGNWWMASVPKHSLWLDMLRYIHDNIQICFRKSNQPNDDMWNVLELTGPYALGRVVVAHLQRLPDARIGVVPLVGGVGGAPNVLPFATMHSAGTWLDGPKPKSRFENKRNANPGPTPAFISKPFDLKALREKILARRAALSV